MHQHRADPDQTEDDGLHAHDGSPLAEESNNGFGVATVGTKSAGAAGLAA
jgi:hypothetical protein